MVKTQPLRVTGKYYIYTNYPEFMLYKRPPDNFKPERYIVAGYLKYNDKLLFLKRNDSHKGSWGPPAGKIENHETPLNAVTREVKEETGVTLGKASLVEKVYVRSDRDLVYTMFTSELDTLPNIELTDEHCDYVWGSYDELMKLQLMPDEKPCLELLKKIKFIK